MITIHCNGNPLDYKESVNHLVHAALNEMIAKRSKSCTVAVIIGAGNTEKPHAMKFTLTFKATPVTTGTSRPVTQPPSDDDLKEL